MYRLCNQQSQEEARFVIHEREEMLPLLVFVPTTEKSRPWDSVRNYSLLGLTVQGHGYVTPRSLSIADLGLYDTCLDISLPQTLCSKYPSPLAAR